METLDLLRAGQLSGARRLDLSCGLTTFPSEILDLADSLEILDLSNNNLTSLPDEFARLHKLRIVFFNNNHFETIPEVLSQCPHLSMISFKSNRVHTLSANALPPLTRWLILTNNQLATLPPSMGQLHRLQKLMLAGNRLQALPEEMAACSRLELIRLAANQLQALPQWLLTLPRLSWLAYAGNPFCEQATSDHPSVTAPALATIDWADLTLGEVLGQGASGVISRGQWQAGETPIDVAVKVFKGEMTSDGLPADEMRACIAAGSHHHLVSVLGKVVNHPDGKAGLVFPFIPATFINLGGPPNLDSCTRDTYAADIRFSLPQVLRIAQGIAAAATHLHRRGILHGDLYPHNTLINESGQSLLGDFGAASFYDPADCRVGPKLERLEVRALGCLLEDLLQRCPLVGTPAGEQEALQQLSQLQHQCLQPNIERRPRFVDIYDGLMAIEAQLQPHQRSSEPLLVEA